MPELTTGIVVHVENLESRIIGQLFLGTRLQSPFVLPTAFTHRGSCAAKSAKLFRSHRLPPKDGGA